MLNTNPVNLFHNQAHDEEMLKKGYLVLPFLDEEDIQFFKSLYQKWHPENPKEFYKSYFDPRIEYKREVENAIIDIFEKKMQGVFRNYHAFGGMFVVKPPTEKGHIPPHQDWSFVDETKEWSINMWCPLIDVDQSSGSIRVLEGSHQFRETIRGVNTPDIYREHWGLVEDNMKSIPMKAGEAIFFFHGLLHGSDLNTKEEPRISLGLTLTPKEAELYLHYYEPESNKLERYNTEPDFYINYASKRDQKPEKSAESVSFEFQSINQKELLSKIKLAQGLEMPGQEKNKKWWNIFNR